MGYQEGVFAAYPQDVAVAVGDQQDRGRRREVRGTLEQVDTGLQHGSAPAPDTHLVGDLDHRQVPRVNARRNWSTLWKPAIDALGPLLGSPDPERPYRPHDDRIVSLALHRGLDESLGHDVVITAWWHAV